MDVTSSENGFAMGFALYLIKDAVNVMFFPNLKKAKLFKKILSYICRES